MKKSINSKATRLIALMFIFVFLLVGCVTEINEKEFVLALGVDAKDDEFVLSASFANPKSYTEQGGSESNIVKTTTGTTLLEAIEKMKTSTHKELFFGQANLLVLGANALNEEMLTEVIKTIERHDELNKSMSVLATEENVEELFNTKLDDNSTISTFMENFYKSTNPENNMKTEQKMYFDMVKDLSETNDTTIPLISINETTTTQEQSKEKSDEQSQQTSSTNPADKSTEKSDEQSNEDTAKSFSVEGLALISDSNYVYSMVDEMIGYSILAEKGVNYSFILPLEEETYYYKIVNNDVRYNFEKTTDDKLLSEISIKMNFTSTNAVEPNNFEEEISKTINNEVSKTLDILQEYNVDALQIENKVEQQNFMVYDQFENIDMQTFEFKIEPVQISVN